MHMKKLETILLIDDSNSSNQYNRVLLKEMGIVEHIVVKSNAEAALEFLRGKDTEGRLPKPDLILLDIAMPQMDGFMFLDEYAKLSKEITNNQQIVVFILSDFLDEDDFEKSKKYKAIGVVEQIKKPMNKEGIINLMQVYFD
jgi:CheY-like chemotaxis protein